MRPRVIVHYRVQRIWAFAIDWRHAHMKCRGWGYVMEEIYPRTVHR